LLKHAIHHFQTAFTASANSRADLPLSMPETLNKRELRQPLQEVTFSAELALDRPPDDYPGEFRRPAAAEPGMSYATGESRHDGVTLFRQHEGMIFDRTGR
jgi:hypothetical protein